MDKISSLIEKEPSLSGKVLRLVNSAHFGTLRKIERIEQAVAFLGIDTIRNVAVSSSIYEAFRDISADPYFSLERFWWHSLSCALISKRLASRIDHPKPEQAFLAGLLHDIGKPVIWINDPDSYRDLLRMYQGREDLILKGEERFGGNHAEIGATLLETWGLESFLVDAVRYHHHPLKQIREALQLVQLVYLANKLAAPKEDPDPALNDAQQLLGVSRPVVEELLALVGDEVQQTADAFGIPISQPEKEMAAGTGDSSAKRRELNDLVQNSALVSAVLKNLAGCTGRDELVAEFRKALLILLDNEPVIIFILDHDDNRMLASYPDDLKSGQMEPLTPVRPPHPDSLIAQCIDQRRLMTSRDRNALVVMDRQLMRYLAADILVCQPLWAHDRPLGAVVLAVEKDRWESFQQQQALLEMFTQQASLSLYAFQVRQSQQEKIVQERHNAFTQLARQVVHEVNNPLTLIKNYLKILDLKLARQNLPHEEIPIINEEIDRIANILQQLGSLGSRRIGPLEPVNVNKLLSDLIALLKEPFAAKSGIAVRLETDPRVPTIESDPRALKQVFINLIKNAGEAMPQGGEIVIRTRSTGAPAPLSVGTAGASEDDEIEISFSDSGPGIPEAIRNVVFEPYVSSKDGGHAGLGLSLVYAVINELGGTITVETETGQGTCFTIRLPIRPRRENPKHEFKG